MKLNSRTLGLFVQLRPYLLGQRWPIAGALLLASAGRSLDIVYIFQFREVMNELQRGGAGMKGALGQAALAILAVQLAKSVIDLGTGLCQGKAAEGFNRALREQLFSRYQDLPLSFFHAHPTGAIVSHMQEAGSLQQMVMILIQSVSHVVWAAGLVSTAFYLDPKLSAALMLTFPAVLIPTRLIGGVYRRNSQEARQVYAKVNSLVMESGIGARVVRVFCGEDFERERFRRSSAEFFRLSWKGMWLDQCIWLVKACGSAGLTAYIIYHVGNEILSGERLIGDLGAYMVAFTSLYRPVEVLVAQYTALQGMLGRGDKVLEILRAAPSGSHDRGRRVLGPDIRSIELRGVSFGYGGKPVLRNVDLSIRAGETAALVGHSGCGKSTLINLLPRLYEPTAGAILFDGVDAREYTLKSLRCAMAIVTQEVFLFEGTIAENIAYARAGCSREELRAAARAAHLEEFIESLPEKYETPVGENGVRLSGGQRQRIAIARAFLKKAPILILDEPTSALDPHTEREVQSAIRNLTHYRIAIVVAHRLSLVQDADRIFLMSNGAIQQEGTHDVLMRGNADYRKLYELQADAKA